MNFISLKNNKAAKTVFAVLFWTAVWEIVSVSLKGLNMFPGPAETVKAWWGLLSDGRFWLSCLMTFLRVLGGLSAGIIAGFVLGVLSHVFSLVRTLVSPVMKMVRAVPVISFIFLAFVMFVSDALPVFISFLMVCPIIWQCVTDGLDSTDRELLEMAQMFRLGKMKTLFRIKIPGLYHSFMSTVANACGLAWKAELAAEAICTPFLSLGNLMYKAKINFDFDALTSLTLTVVIISVVFEMLIKRLFGKLAGKGAQK